MGKISRSVPKIDFDEKVSGQAQFVADIKKEGLLFARTFRSTITKGKIKSIKYPVLEPGYFIIDQHDIPHENYVKMIFKDWKIFADDTINYYGEPICLIVGEDKAKIEEIMKQIVITYDIETPVFGYENSVISKAFKKGHPDEAFDNATKIISQVYETGYQEQAYIEPQGFIGYLDQDKITLIGSIQCPYYVKNALIEMLQCDEKMIRVIQAPVGGAFGGKEEFPSMMACQLALALLKVKKPIQLIYEREEDMISTTKRHPSQIKLEAAIDQNNHVMGLKAHVSLDGGAYIGLSGVVLSRAMLAVTSAYTIDHLDVSGDVYITNTVPNGAFRGFGAPQMIFSIEMFMNYLSKSLGVDEFEFRMIHLAKQGDLTSTSGLFRDPIIIKEMIEKATSISDYHHKRKIYEHKDANKGIGMSWFLHGCGFTGSGESTHINAKVRLKKDKNDHVYVLCAAVDMGQGARTTLRKIVIETLEIDEKNVTFDYPDTDVVPDSGPTVASRTIMIVGGLLRLAALELKSLWKPNESIEVNKQYQQPEYIKWDEDQLKGDAYPAYSWGVNVVEVEFNPITYQVDLKKIWSVYDIGQSIDDRIVFGQADGGIAQGVAYGYMEVMQQKEGILQQKNMTDYIIPTSVDMPETETHIFENPFALGPYGAKGVGELTLVGGAPAVCLAISQAIKKDIFKIPATPEYLMEVLNDEN